MRKDKFNEEIEKKVDIEFDFNDIKNDINIVVKPKKSRTTLKVLVPVLSASFAIIAASIIILPRLFTANSSQSQKMDEGATANSDMQYGDDGESHEAPGECESYYAARFDFSKFQTTFEQNLDFIATGIELSIEDINGNETHYYEEDLIINSSNFEKGVVGSYRIDVQVKNNPEYIADYYVDVIEDRVSSIEVTNYKAEYHIGEDILKSDISVKKINESNNEYTLKTTEYGIDTSKFNNQVKGDYQIEIYLLANPQFSVTYQVSVVD